MRDRWQHLHYHFRHWPWTVFGVIVSIFLIWRIGTVGAWSLYCWILLLACLVTVRRDQIDVQWNLFFLLAIPLLAIFYYFYSSGDGIWYYFADRLFHNNSSHIFAWDHLMKGIPLNSADWMRAVHFPLLDRTLIWVYNYGFVLSLWICIIRAFWTKSIRKMLSYALSGHLLQFPLILPLYNLFLVHEVWFVKHEPDLLHRKFASHNQMMVEVMNCFPSMHTSIAFAMLLLALREKDRVFKLLMVTYCSAIIISTMYLQIHWVIDVIAGMLFALGIVKFSDWILRLWDKRPIPLLKKPFGIGKQNIST